MPATSNANYITSLGHVLDYPESNGQTSNNKSYWIITID